MVDLFLPNLFIFFFLDKIFKYFIIDFTFIPFEIEIIIYIKIIHSKFL